MAWGRIMRLSYFAYYKMTEPFGTWPSAISGHTCYFFAWGFLVTCPLLEQHQGNYIKQYISAALNEGQVRNQGLVINQGEKQAKALP